MANNDLEKFLAGSGLNRVWEKVFSLVKILTGDVDVSTKGTLQKQLDDVRAIANGRKQGKVFATTDDMKTWLKNSANAGLLNIGDNLYIVEKDVPDWWISGVLTTADSSTGYFYTIEPLEGPKIDLSSYDTAISKLNEDITTHKSSGDHDDRYYTESEMNTKLNTKLDKSLIKKGTITTSTPNWVNPKLKTGDRILLSAYVVSGPSTNCECRIHYNSDAKGYIIVVKDLNGNSITSGTYKIEYKYIELYL